MKQLKGLILFLFLSSSLLLVAEDELVLTTVMLSGEYRETLTELINEFNAEHPGIHLVHRIEEIHEFNRKVEGSLTKGESEVDIFLWFAGYNFDSYVRRGRVAPLDEFWKEAGLDRYFSMLKQNVSLKGRVYGIPLSYYPWGFFYSKSLFRELGLEPPQNWDQFHSVCTVLKSRNIEPILLGGATPFACSAWFSYINLRLHGLDFHLSLLRGEHSWKSPEVLETFKEWQSLINNGFFAANRANYTYLSALPYLYRKKGGMMLMGNMILSRLPDTIRPDIGFFRFPRIRESIPMYEEAPLDILFIPVGSSNKAAAKLVLAFFARPEINSRFNRAVGYLSPNALSPESKDPLLNQTASHLTDASGFSYFFNRNSPPEAGAAGTAILQNFANGDITIGQATSRLEDIRVDYLKNR